ncbi:UNVERIFIED_CONTAM: hypothetical protein FKN15_036359 [Acipenser sinensis]
MPGVDELSSSSNTEWQHREYWLGAGTRSDQQGCSTLLHLQSVVDKGGEERGDGHCRLIELLLNLLQVMSDQSGSSNHNNGSASVNTEWQHREYWLGAGTRSDQQGCSTLLHLQSVVDKGGEERGDGHCRLIELLLNLLQVMSDQSGSSNHNNGSASVNTGEATAQHSRDCETHTHTHAHMLTHTHTHAHTHTYTHAHTHTHTHTHTRSHTHTHSHTHTLTQCSFPPCFPAAETSNENGVTAPAPGSSTNPQQGGRNSGRGATNHQTAAASGAGPAVSNGKETRRTAKR